jgi:4-amino-4-deoxy-L-arabinose transferase-like glycosyltransferase
MTLPDSGQHVDHRLARVSLLLCALCLAALGLVPVANHLTDGRAVPWWPAAVQEWITAGGGVVVVTLLLARLISGRAASLVERIRRVVLAPSPRAFGIVVSVVVGVLSAVFAWYCFSGTVFTGDEIAQRWHARILLSGHLFAHAEPAREFFSTTEVLDSGGKWFSQFPVGGPAFLALGLALGLPWIVNPCLAAFTTHQLYQFVRRAYDDTTARLTVLLFAVSPFVLIMSASEMNHVATLAMVTLALAQLGKWATATDARDVTWSAAIVGLSLGVAASVRPMDAALAAVAVGGFQLITVMKDRSRARSLVVQAAVGAIPIALLLGVNAMTTGHPLLFAYDALNGPSHRPGFHVDPFGAPFTPRVGLTLTSGYLMKLNRYLFEWPLPGLLFVIAGLVGVRRASRWDGFLVGLLGVILAGYAYYWFDGFFAGPRFLFTALPAIVVFAGRAPRALAALARDKLRSPVAATAALLIVPACIVYAWAVPTGVSSVQLRAFYYRQQHGKLKVDVAAQVADAKLSHALVFIPETWHDRIVARLRALEMRPLVAERLLDSTDACALQTALDEEDTLPARDASERLARVLARARSVGRAVRLEASPLDEPLALVPGRPITRTCADNLSADGQPTMSYSLFLMEQQIDRDGRIGGDVVFARDFGPRDTILAPRFGDRTWYRYVPAPTPGGTPRFVPIPGSS